MCRNHADEAMGAFFRGTGQCFTDIQGVVLEQTPSDEEHGHHRQEEGLLS